MKLIPRSTQCPSYLSKLMDACHVPLLDSNQLHKLELTIGWQRDTGGLRLPFEFRPDQMELYPDCNLDKRIDTLYLTYFGILFDCRVQAGKFEGNGGVIFPGGYSYDGMFVDGMPHDYGKMNYPKGNYYIGQWQQGKRKGTGTIYYNSSSRPNFKLTGKWKDDKLDGSGKWTDVYGNYLLEFSQHTVISWKLDTSSSSLASSPVEYQSRIEYFQKYVDLFGENTLDSSHLWSVQEFEGAELPGGGEEEKANEDPRACDNQSIQIVVQEEDIADRLLLELESISNSSLTESKLSEQDTNDPSDRESTEGSEPATSSQYDLNLVEVYTGIFQDQDAILDNYRKQSKRLVQKINTMYCQLCQQRQLSEKNEKLVLDIGDLSLQVKNSNYQIRDLQQDKAQLELSLSSSATRGHYMEEAIISLKKKYEESQSNWEALEENHRQLSDKLVESESKYQDLEDRIRCKICKTNMCDIILMPCKHLVLCSDCEKTYHENQIRCPLCRDIYSEIIPFIMG